MSLKSKVSYLFTKFGLIHQSTMLMRQKHFIHSTVLIFFVFLQLISVVSSFIVSHQPQRSTHFGLYHRLTTTKMSSSDGEGDKDEPHCPNVLFIECGFGNDSHGQSSTKAAGK